MVFDWSKVNYRVERKAEYRARTGLSNRLVVVKVNDNSILKGKVFPGDCIFRVQVENEIATVMCWEQKRFGDFLGRKKGQEKILVFDPPKGCYKLSILNPHR
jgi:hypothetical protein